MEEIWIIGVGRFGSIAYQRLSKTRKTRRFVLVDPVEENLSRCKGPYSTFEKADGVDFLKENLFTHGNPDWIIPALPVHLAAEWILARLGPGRLRRVTLPHGIEPLLPNSIRGTDGNIYVSHADFRCPDDCAEPRDICTATGEKRKQNMFEILGDIRFLPYRPLAIRSRQLAPGVGGYRPKELRSLMDQVDKAGGQLLLSTACRCHGVITGLERL
ncbi:MAG: potassium transporter [Pseudomonadota bacterium]